MEKVSEFPPFMVRMPRETRAWLEDAAKKNCRSMNAEVVFLLQKEKALSATNTQGFNANSTVSI